ncbi:MAG: PaaI family thioesterase [Calditrichia bacterium]
MKGYLPTYDGCMVCGVRDVNPAAMQVRFYWDGEKIDTRVHPDAIYNGYDGILHGGVITALLDEAMGWAAAVERKCYFVTGEINVRFLKPVLTKQALRLVCRCVEHRARYSISVGELEDESGQVLARGEGKFFEIPYVEALKIKKYLHFKKDDLDILENPKERGQYV